MVRDPKRSKEELDENIKEFEEEIKKTMELLSSKQNLNKYLVYFSLDGDRLEKALAKYARGDDIAEVKKELEIAVLGRQEHRLETGFDITLYGENIEEFCVRILLDMDTFCLLKLIEEDEAKRRDIYNRDWFLHFIGSKGKNLNLERKCASFVKEHELIKEFVASKDINFLHQYMKKHTRLRDPINTWNLQGAAVVKIMNLDKDEFKDYKYFPYDLI
ncbi:DUF1911 domain-containing protein [Helicobacter sp. MIT 03-1614]|uniref:PoNe immunity protein domain-containing protein n=1 Tax=Helicobacter sp. MIT 03-1614 TaxID=1548147 RepID=UPI000513435A|nr:PoNe immunity protein domain-containing protein [Helicobacter sp. MIT 03-1614]TLD89677.1 DUF1911 domain-containing protein [Helicobacter sp. MIT 03-1614]